MKVLLWTAVLGLATLTGACGGGDDEACKKADDVAQQIKTAAAADMISTEGLCVSSKADIASRLMEAQYPGDISVRAADYVNACEKYATLSDQCDG